VTPQQRRERVLEDRREHVADLLTDVLTGDLEAFQRMRGKRQLNVIKHLSWQDINDEIVRRDIEKRKSEKSGDQDGVRTLAVRD